MISLLNLKANLRPDQFIERRNSIYRQHFAPDWSRFSLHLCHLVFNFRFWIWYWQDSSGYSGCIFSVLTNCAAGSCTVNRPPTSGTRRVVLYNIFSKVSTPKLEFPPGLWNPRAVLKLAVFSERVPRIRQFKASNDGFPW